MNNNSSANYHVKVQMIDERPWFTKFLEDGISASGARLAVVILPIRLIFYMISKIIYVTSQQKQSQKKIRYRLDVYQVSNKDKVIAYSEDIPETVPGWKISQVEYRLSKALEKGRPEEVITALREQKTRLFN